MLAITEMVNNIVIGCLVGVVSSATQSIGLTLQRKSHMEASDGPSRGPVHRRGLWRIGLMLFLLSNVLGSTVQITTLPLIVLSPLQAIGLVFNSICASVILEEKFIPISLVGTILVAVGALVIAGFGAIPEPKNDLDKLLFLLHRRQFIIWMTLSLTIVCCLLIFIRMITVFNCHHTYGSSISTPAWHTANNSNVFHNHHQHHNNNHYYHHRHSASCSTTAIATGSPAGPPAGPSSATLSGGILSDFKNVTTDTISKIFMATKTLSHFVPRPHTLKGLLYGVVSGILSAHSLLMAKSAVELLVAGVSDRWKDYFRWQSWVIVCMFLIFALLQLYFLNCGLRLCSTSILYPLVFCIFNITAILNGLIYFQQASLLTYLQISMVGFGTFLVLLGVLCLSWRLELRANGGEYPSIQSPMMSSEGNQSSQFELPTETSPLIIRARSATPNSHVMSIDNEPGQYTSFCSINEGAIPEPTSPYSGRRLRGRTISMEQSEILDQIRKV